MGRVSGNSHCWDVDQVITVERLGCELGRGGAWQGRVTTGPLLGPLEVIAKGRLRLG